MMKRREGVGESRMGGDVEMTRGKTFDVRKVGEVEGRIVAEKKKRRREN